MRHARRTSNDISSSDDTARIASRSSKHMQSDQISTTKNTPASSKITVPEIDSFDNDNTQVVFNADHDTSESGNSNYPGGIVSQGSISSDSAYDADEPGNSYELPNPASSSDISPLTSVITQNVISDPNSASYKPSASNKLSPPKERGIHKTKSLTVILAALVVVAFGAATIFALNSAPSNTTDNSDLQTAVVTQESFVDSVSTNGIAQPNSSVVVMSEVDGTISEVLVNEGDEVTEGQTLFTISNDDLDSDVTKAEQSVSSAESKVTAAQTVLDNANKKTAVSAAQNALDEAKDELSEANSAISDAREAVTEANDAEEELQEAFVEEQDEEDEESDEDEDTSDDGVTSEELDDAEEEIDNAKKNLKAVESSYDLEALQEAVDSAQNDLSTAKSEAESDIEEAKDSLNSAKIELEQAETTLEEAKAEAAKRTVTAPVDGTVIVLTAKVGNAVNASTTASSSSDVLDTSALVQIGDVSKIKFIAQVSEADKPRISEKLPATISFTSIADKTYDATVSSIANVITNSDASSADEATYSVTLLLDDTSDSQVKPGMTGTADIIIQEVPDTLTLPANAVHTTDTGAYYVMLVTNTADDGSYETVRRTVIVEGTDGTTTAISSGVIAGDIVILGDVSTETSNVITSTPDSGSAS